ncbi:MAG: DUF192 domain-containing protein [Anaerolineae bacterium]
MINRTRQTVLVEQGWIADNLWSRMVGLLGRSGLEPGQGLLLKGEQAIHMFWMKFAIDVVYLDKQGRVLCAIDSLRPWRLGPYLRQASDVLELPAGTCNATQTRVGDELAFELTT